MNLGLTLLQAPAVACILLGITYAWFGVHVLRREIIFVDLSLAQLAAMGTTVAFAFDFDHESGWVSILSFLFVLAGAAFFTWIKTARVRISQEAVIGIVYVVSASFALILASRSPHGAEHIRSMLNGSVLWITWDGVGKLTLAVLAVGTLHAVFHRKFVAVSESYGITLIAEFRLWIWDFLFYLTLGAVIVFSVDKAGVFLVFTLLIIPSVCGTLFTKSIYRQFFSASILSAFTSLMGLGVSYYLDLPTGATLVCAFGAVFLFVLITRLISAPRP